MKRAVFLLVLLLALAGCGIKQHACLARCLDDAIDQHVQKGINERNDSVEKSDLREVELIMERVRCKVDCYQ